MILTFLTPFLVESPQIAKLTSVPLFVYLGWAIGNVLTWWIGSTGKKRKESDVGFCKVRFVDSMNDKDIGVGSRIPFLAAASGHFCFLVVRTTG